MKKLLYSSAVLIASCGMAAAQVSVGGAAKVGIKYTEGAGMGMSIFHDVDLTLTLSGQTDGGLSFGAEMTIDNDQGVSVDLAKAVEDGAGNGTSTTAMDTDTNTHTGMFYSTTGRTYLDSMGMPVYTEMADTAGTGLTKIYHTRIPGSNYALGPNATAVTSGTGANAVTVMDVTLTAPATTISIFDSEMMQKAWILGTQGPSGGAIHKWGDRYVVETGTGDTAFTVLEMDGDMWKSVGTITEVTTAALDGFTASSPATPSNILVVPLLNEIHRSVSASEAGMAQMQDTMPNDPVTFTNTNTHSVESVKSAKISDDSSVYISGGFGKISVGAVDAGDVMASGIADIGFDGIGVDNMAEGLRGGSNADFLYEFSAGGVSFGLSADSKGDNSALGIKYSLDPISVGIGYSNLEDDNVLSIGIGASLGGVSTNIMYSTQKSGGTATGMDASFAAADNMTVTIAAASKKDKMGMSDSAYGLGLSFDLGGGATLKTGVGTVSDVTKAELGLNLTF